jgi:NAD(P)H-hydrate epimerase
MTQGMAALEAASAAAWLHGRVAESIGPGLIAEDLPGKLVEILKDLKAFAKP